MGSSSVIISSGLAPCGNSKKGAISACRRVLTLVYVTLVWWATANVSGASK